MNWLPDRFETLVYWIRERENIRLLKEAGAPRPWTSDPILAAWRFCNVDRCDDTVTRWIFANIIAKHATSPTTLWFNLVIARLVNWPDTLAKLGYYDVWQPEHFIQTVNNLSGKVWTGAYMIPAGPAGISKASFLADKTLTPLWAALISKPMYPSLAEAFQERYCANWFYFISCAPAMGDFLTNQVVTDMKYTPMLANAPDRDTFVMAGPGTQRGLNRLFGRDLKKAWKREESQAALLEVREAVITRLPKMVETFRDLNNLSNCFCEFDKYERVRLGEGKPRSRYVPATQNVIPFPPAGWYPHPDAAGWFHNYKECLTEEQLRAKIS